MAEDDGERKGFIGRWASRKNDALKGKPLDEPARPTKTPLASATPPTTALPVTSVTSAVPAAVTPSPLPAEAAPPALSLDDVRLLTKDSDFKPFMAQSVGPEVRNAAMKKLFADPHFNVMDGLDIYIDDYSKSDPIPESMLRQMTSAKFLGLFDEEDDEEKGAKTAVASAPRESANSPADQTVAQSIDNTDIAHTADRQPQTPSQPESALTQPDLGASQQDHAHTDLRLQPDHAAPAPEAGRRT